MKRFRYSCEFLHLGDALHAIRIAVRRNINVKFKVLDDGVFLVTTTSNIFD